MLENNAAQSGPEDLSFKPDSEWTPNNAKKFRRPIGLQHISVPPGEIVKSRARLQTLFKPDTLHVWPPCADYFTITDIQIDGESQLLTDTPIPCSTFKVESSLECKTIGIGQEIVFFIQNRTGDELDFRATLIGTTAE